MSVTLTLDGGASLPILDENGLPILDENDLPIMSEPLSGAVTVSLTCPSLTLELRDA